MTSEVRNQLELMPSPEGPHVEPVTPSLISQIMRRPTMRHAWNFGQDFSTLQDKQCYDPLGMDNSHWSKIRKGTASPPADERFTKYLDIVQNEFPLIWLCEARGYDFMTLRKHQTNTERENADLREENQFLRRAMALWADSQKAGK